MAASLAALTVTPAAQASVVRIPHRCASRPAILLCSVHFHAHRVNRIRLQLGYPRRPYGYAAEHHPLRRARLLEAWVEKHADWKRRLGRYLDRHATPAPVALGRQMATARGWTGSQWTALYALWNRESGWNPGSMNTSSGACGIPQFVPCRDWGDTAAQIRDGLTYIAERYGTPSAALSHSDTLGWY